ncbi:N-acetylgalactosamine-N,N'-diacetylbacillosaminyl-diphospho-undecaprenol 4-alpha-N-acetylgalactosaminyltransferase [Halomonas sp. THAF5a]|uniref:glycosyltransferase n=1 Tax=Halomonas sp. THAF5a TaxID=2587844 RepID=UPI001268806E|nr:glycosyltransferase [Halomonas sp. THAF5a]QFU01507.1 N-acetylgalactosamine-N,N'-diacetylbacillosaminyl-diphospho-undecaprenol 4-alpha-N-acetylgalactosaminyltransferase [Halomonas sp. THAF5a]
MRTLVVVRSLKMGGMERVAVNLADAFAEAGHESHLLSLRQVDRPLAPEHPKVQQHALALRWWSRLTGVGLVLELLARLFLNPLVKRSLFLGTGIMGGVVFRLWLKAFERRHGRVDRIIFRGVGTFELVWSFRDARGRYVLENILHVDEANWRRRLFAHCLYHRRHLVTVSEGVADSTREAMQVWHFEPASLNVIPNPCPLAGIRRQMVEPEPDLPDGPYIVNVARLVPAKDQALLLRAYARSQVTLPLVLVGDGQERGRLEALAKELGIAERVIFAGQRSNPYPWMRHARLFVLSSRFEGMGIVLFEAMACGTPVLSVDCPGGIRTILKGELEECVVPHDEAGLAAGIQQALEGEKPAVKEAWLDDFRPEVVAARFLQ